MVADAIVELRVLFEIRSGDTLETLRIIREISYGSLDTASKIGDSRMLVVLGSHRISGERGIGVGLGQLWAEGWITVVTRTN